MLEMASACVNSIGVTPENFIDYSSSDLPAYGWLSPRISFSREYSDEDSKRFTGEKSEKKKSEVSDPAEEHGDFEFCLDDPVKMLPADELFSDGKLVPLRISVAIPVEEDNTTEEVPEGRNFCASNEVLSIADDDPCASSPKAPRCSSRWREFLGLRKNKQEANSKSTSSSNPATTSFCTSSSKNTGNSIRQFLHKTSKSMSAFSASDASLRLPLLKDSDSESVSIASSRFSLSSSSSGHDHDDFPRFSLDCDNRPSRSHLSTNQSLNQPRVRMVKPRMVPISVAEDPKPLIDHPSAPVTAIRARPRGQQDPAAITRRLSMDSPRMISSGKIVFESLERSSSSPSSINGGPRYRNKGVERSYSTNVRITPVLNVPVCSLRGSSKSGVLGFGQLFSSQSKKKEGNGGASNSNLCCTETLNFKEFPCRKPGSARKRRGSGRKRPETVKETAGNGQLIGNVFGNVLEISAPSSYVSSRFPHSSPESNWN